MTTPLKRHVSDDAHPEIHAPGINLDAFQTGRLTRSIEIPYYERQRRTMQVKATWLGSLFSKQTGVRIYDIDLHEDWVLIENTSRKPVPMGSFSLCDEERIHKLEFPEDLILGSKQFLKVICAPGRTRNLETFEEDGRTTLLLWKTPAGGLRTDHVLRPEGDCMYLYDNSGLMMSALAKASDGTFKEFGPLNEVREQAVWRSLGIFAVAFRVVLIAAAAYQALHTNLSTKATSAHPQKVIFPLLGAILCDLFQREAVLHAHIHDFLGESLSILADRLHAMVIFATLAVYYGDYCGLFLLLLALDLTTSWVQLFASDCGELEMKDLFAQFAKKAPSLLTLICLLNEAFLLLLYVDHGHVQFRLFQGTMLANWPFSGLTLTKPVLREALLLAFVLKQIMNVSQLWVCLGSLVNTTFPCPTDAAKGYLQQALESRNRPNIELLRHSESLHTLRAN